MFAGRIVVCVLLLCGVGSPAVAKASSDAVSYVRVLASTFTEMPIQETYTKPLSLTDFDIARTEVTAAQWNDVAQWAQGHGYSLTRVSESGDAPVSGIAYVDAVVWLNASSEKAGKTPVYRTVQGMIIRDRAQVTSEVVAGAFDGDRLPTSTEWTVAAYVIGTSPLKTTAQFQKTHGRVIHYYNDYGSNGIETIMYAVREKQGLVYWAPQYYDTLPEDQNTAPPNALGLIGMDASLREHVVGAQHHPGHAAGGDTKKRSLSVRDCACVPTVGDERMGLRPVRTVFSSLDDAHIALPTPQSGANAVMSLDAMTFTATVQWSPALQQQTFAHNVAYTARVTLTPKSPYTLTEGMTMRVPRAQDVSIAGNVVTASFAKTASNAVHVVPVHGVIDGKKWPKFALGTTEVTRRQWNDTVSWALAKGYRFAGGTDSFWRTAYDMPYVGAVQRDVLVWLNAHSAREGRDPAYRDAQGRVLTDSTKDSAIDVVRASAYNGYRLPTEQELYVAGSMLVDSEAGASTKGKDVKDTKATKTFWNSQYAYADAYDCYEACFGFGESGDVVTLPQWAQTEYNQKIVSTLASGIGANAREWIAHTEKRAVMPQEKSAFRVAYAMIDSAQDVPMPLVAPVAGAQPQTAIDTTPYTGSVSWTPALRNGRFAPQTKYVATVALQARSPYALDRIVVPGAMSVRMVGNTAKVTFAPTQRIVEGKEVLFRAQILEHMLLSQKIKPPIRIQDLYVANTEVTYRDWWDIVQWGKKNGYTFVGSGTEGSRGVVGAAPTERQFEPVVNLDEADVFVWLNAKSEKSGLRPVYVDRNNRVLRNAVTDAALLKDAVLVQSLRAQTARNGYRLPVYDEWIVMARFTGTTRKAQFPSIAKKVGKITYYWLDVNNDTPLLQRIAWYGGVQHTQPVGQKNPSPLGIYDAFGNVQELVFFPEGVQHPIIGNVWYVDGVGGDIYSSKPSLATCYSLDGCSKQVFGMRTVRTK
jgi:formylglycine-generating enzyme required for sulfatase activity